MNQIPLLKSRLKMPEPPDNLIISAHIKELHDKMQEKNVVVICAPAGYGKTTFLSSFFQIGKAQGHRVCWYSLEQEDREPQVFLMYLIEALFPAEDSIWKTTLKILDECIIADSNLHYIISIICQEMWSYYNSDKNAPISIVLDDFHHICDILEIRDALSFLFCNLPPNCTIFINSRYSINLFSEKQKLDRKILTINSDDLCFTENDIKDNFSDIAGISEIESLAGKIAQYTEGWIAGITIICNALKEKKYKDPFSHIEKNSRQVSLFNYFSSEILKSIEPDIMCFLVKLALLREFTTEDAKAILDLNDVPRLVDQCIISGVFIQKIHTHETVMYRFHSLFRDALTEIQPQYLSVKEVKEYNLNAANYFLRKKIYGNAIEHLLKCDDVTLISEILLKESISMDVFQDVHQLHLMFDLLPEYIVSGNAVLLFIKGLTYMHSRYEDSFDALSLSFKNARRSGDLLMQLNIALAIVYAYYSTNNMNGIKQLLPQLQRPSLPYDKPFTEAAVTLTEMIYAVFSDKLRTANTLFYKIDTHALDRNLKWPYYVISCILHYRMGKYNKAIKLMEEALEMEEIRKAPILKAQAGMFYSFPLMLKKDFHSLKPLISEVLSAGEKYNFGYLLGNGKFILAYLKYTENDVEGALECLDYAVMYFSQINNSAMSEFSKLVKYLWLSQDSNPQDFIPDAIKSLNTLKKLHAGYELYEIGQSILGILFRNEEDYKGAEQSFLSSIASSEKKGALQVSCGSYIHLAKLYFDTDNTSKGVEYLRIAFDKASSNTYYMFWDIHYPTLVEMSLRAIKLSINADYSLKLLEEHFGKVSTGEIRAKLPLLGENDIEDFVRDFLISRSSSPDDVIPRIKVSLFGEFKIQVNRELIPEKAWKTKKIKGILVYLLLNSGKAVSREFLTELFWPGSDKKSASISFRAALYELKRVLTHYGMLTKEGNSIIHETASGLEICKSNSIIIDIDEFNNLVNQMKALNLSSDRTPHEILIQKKIVHLYKGDLLENEAFDDWILIDREKFKSIFLDTALKLALEYFKREDHKKAENILSMLFSHDPYNEEAALLLVNLYISTNQKGRALSFYTSFKERMEGELGVKIDHRLTSVINGIMVK